MFTMSSPLSEERKQHHHHHLNRKFWTSLSLDTWSWEWLSIAFSVFCFIATVGLLLAYQSSPSPNLPPWPNPEHYRHHNRPVGMLSCNVSLLPGNGRPSWELPRRGYSNCGPRSRRAAPTRGYRLTTQIPPISR